MTEAVSTDATSTQANQGAPAVATAHAQDAAQSVRDTSSTDR